MSHKMPPRKPQSEESKRLWNNVGNVVLCVAGLLFVFVAFCAFQFGQTDGQAGAGLFLGLLGVCLLWLMACRLVASHV
jgi:hypothetical protein